jgi:hypothetical protein
MQNPIRYLRLFDEKKYREIQPIIEGIVKRNADAEQVIFLLEAVKGITQTDDFRKYHDPEDADSYAEKFQSIQNIIMTSGISVWFDMLDRKEYHGIDILPELFSMICCPTYQWSTFERSDISGTTIEYGNIYYGFRVCDLDSLEMFSFHYPIERLPVEMKGEGTVIGIFNQKQLASLTKAATDDTSTLSQLKCSIDEDQDRRLEYLDFHNSLNYLLRLANSRPEYTILNMKHN